MTCFLSVSRETEYKTPSKESVLLVLRVGFEPTAFSLGRNCSIQLSYRSIVSCETGINPVASKS